MFDFLVKYRSCLMFLEIRVPQDDRQLSAKDSDALSEFKA